MLTLPEISVDHIQNLFTVSSEGTLPDEVALGGGIDTRQELGGK